MTTTETKLCTGCPQPIVRRADETAHQHACRRYCSTACLQRAKDQHRRGGGAERPRGGSIAKVGGIRPSTSTLTTRTDTTWASRAACAGLTQPDVFFHPDTQGGLPRGITEVKKRQASKAEREDAAKAICARCPVIASCRRDALARREPYGVFGGLTEDERAQLLKQKGAPA